MTTLAVFKERVETGVAALDARIEEAADLAALVRSDALPAQSPWAFAIPLGIDGGAPDAAAGIYRQSITEVVGLVLVVQAPGDPSGADALGTIDELIIDIVQRVCGWAPDDVPGVFVLRRGRLLSVANGAVIYQLDFALDDQLRIT